MRTGKSARNPRRAGDRPGRSRRGLVPVMAWGRWSPVVLALAVALPVSAQTPAGRSAPHAGYVYPAGGQQGTRFSVAVGGQGLNGAVSALISGKGAHVRVTGYQRPLTPREFNALREQVQQLQQRRQAARQGMGDKGAGTAVKPGWSAEDEKLLAELRRKLADRPNRQANPALAETVMLEVALDPDAESGVRELRLRTAAGLTNPVRFGVGQLREFSEAPAPTSPAPRLVSAPRGSGPPAAAVVPVVLPAVVNGQIMPGEVDRFRFQARAGQRLVVIAEARALMPYLADAVPGWFQATLTLFDAAGAELAFDDDFLFQPDPVLGCEIPRDGEYVVAIRDALYRGREDFVYRITVGEVPFVASVYPLGGPAAQPTQVELAGWNLPAASATVAPPPGVMKEFPFVVERAGLRSNAVRFAQSEDPEGDECEPNDQPATAPLLVLPRVVNGRISTAGDIDVFRIDAPAGKAVVCELVARRLDSPLDGRLRLTDAAGRLLASNDDSEDPAAGLTTHQADPRLSLTLPAGGPYFLEVADVQHQGGREFAYRLEVRAPRPDFVLRVVPASLNVRGGMSAPVTVHAVRRDGFAGEIILGLRDAPPGVRLDGARIPAGQDQVRLTVTAAATPEGALLDLQMEGRARIAGRWVTRDAVPAEDMMQAFAYHHLVPAQQWKLAIAPGGGRRLRAASSGREALPVARIPVGGSGQVSVPLPIGSGAENLSFELGEPPEGVTLEDAVVVDGAVRVVLSCAAGAVTPGLEGNLIMNVFAERRAPAGSTNDAARSGASRRIHLGTLPAIPFLVTASSP